MNDMISRHAVMNRIENEYRKWGDEYDVPQILGDIEDFPSAEPRWIPVSERLPESKGLYLVTYHPCYWDDVERDKTLVGIDTFRGKTTWAQKKYQRVIAWMPLPEPYQEKKDASF